ncbi:hypothetical protein EDB81DRAFT_143773 [Dactylonectria macrodidyma]|uniref:Uncharacterized protein n=1 Tax=Dactylonectria macrodidyma TaxID=307937 RepID=A0A9P9DYW2_9HYPO|nr:hypothetical protein EDB81DRAFT_143773 [Dactylonectria macrodidyma]
MREREICPWTETFDQPLIPAPKPESQDPSKRMQHFAPWLGESQAPSKTPNRNSRPSPIKERCEGAKQQRDSTWQEEDGVLQCQETSVHDSAPKQPPPQGLPPRFRPRRPCASLQEARPLGGILVGSVGVALAVGLLGLAVGLGSLDLIGGIFILIFLFVLFLFLVIGLGLVAIGCSDLAVGCLGFAVGLVGSFGLFVFLLLGILLALFFFFLRASFVPGGDVPISSLVSKVLSLRGHRNHRDQLLGVLGRCHVHNREMEMDA